jgi:hypothetical protein
MSTSFHPQMDEQTDSMNRSISQILQMAICPDQKDWVKKIDMMEFMINLSISTSTGYAPFEITGGYMPQIIKEFKNIETSSKGIQEFVTKVLTNIAAAHNSIIESKTFQTFHTNQRRGEDPILKKGDLVYLSTKNLNLPKGQARKLCPKYIGSYKISEAETETSNYTLELPKPL